MYTKLFSSLLNSSVWSEDAETCKVWITLLALADRDGFVFASTSGIARIAALPIESVDAAIEKFLSPDPRSQDRERGGDGRRISPGPNGGWEIINYVYYRDLTDAELRRGQNRAAKQRERDRQQRSANVSKRHQSSAPVTPSEAESDTESDTESKEKRDRRFARPSLDEVKKHAEEKGWREFDAEAFHAFYESKGWVVGKSPMRSWKAAMISWRKHDGDFGRGEESRPRGNVLHNPEAERMELDWNSNEKIMAEMEGRPMRPWPGR
jgi:hypothetical protein